ncbi:unnamed protein product [Rotaria sp. Silwood2]|nr:unnamed protein product [Rotaria sp. Silwood2]CAF4015248.1 unnamed protein product [Rotaria sp. Silwood2]CAF4291182.1 unnamed protein product [Rotaria sp. Silwood2]
MYHLIVFVLISIKSGHSNSVGAPQSACALMMPQHGVSSQPCSLKYTMESDKLQYSAGDTIHITVRGSTESDTFRGILLIAKTKTNEQIIGNWAVVGSDIKTLACDKIKNTGITHNSPSDKSSIEAIWHAPSNINEEFTVIKATIVETFDQIYVNCFSITLTAKSSNPTTTGASTTSSTGTTTPSKTTTHSTTTTSTTTTHSTTTTSTPAPSTTTTSTPTPSTTTTSTPTPSTTTTSTPTPSTTTTSTPTPSTTTTHSTTTTSTPTPSTTTTSTPTPTPTTTSTPTPSTTTTSTPTPSTTTFTPPSTPPPTSSSATSPSTSTPSSTKTSITSSSSSAGSIISWTYDNGVTSVKMQINNLKTSQWVALGLSFDSKMGEDHIFVCKRLDNDTISVDRCINPSGTSPPVLASTQANSGGTLTSTSLKFDNGVAYCEFTLSNFSSTKRRRRDISPLSQSMTYIPLIAIGNLDSSNEMIMHTSRTALSQKIQLNKEKTISYNVRLIKSEGTSLMKAHAVIMIFAWIFYVPTGMVLF